VTSSGRDLARTGARPLPQLGHEIAQAGIGRASAVGARRVEGAASILNPSPGRKPARLCAAGPGLSDSPVERLAERQIIAARAADPQKATRAIARELGVSERHVRRVLAQERESEAPRRQAGRRAGISSALPSSQSLIVRTYSTVPSPRLRVTTSIEATDAAVSWSHSWGCLSRPPLWKSDLMRIGPVLRVGFAGIRGPSGDDTCMLQPCRDQCARARQVSFSAKTGAGPTRLLSHSSTYSAASRVAPVQLLYRKATQFFTGEAQDFRQNATQPRATMI
jgi:transposase-like protein